MERKKSGYTEFPTTDENPNVTASRVVAWILSQLTPKQFRETMMGLGFSVTENSRVELSPTWAARAVIPLIDHPLGVLLGIRLDHPNLQRGPEKFTWKSKGIALAITKFDEEGMLLVEATDPTPVSLDHAESLDVWVSNIYQEIGGGTSTQVPFFSQEDSAFAIEIPTLVEGVPAVMLWISPDLKEFREKIRPPTPLEFGLPPTNLN